MNNSRIVRPRLFKSQYCCCPYTVRKCNEMKGLPT